MEEDRDQAREEASKEAGEVQIPGDQIISITRHVRLNRYIIHTKDGIYQADTIEEVQDPKQGKKSYSFRPISFTSGPIPRDPFMEE